MPLQSIRRRGHPSPAATTLPHAIITNPASSVGRTAMLGQWESDGITEGCIKAMSGGGGKRRRRSREIAGDRRFYRSHRSLRLNRTSRLTGFDVQRRFDCRSPRQRRRSPRQRRCQPGPTAWERCSRIVDGGPPDHRISTRCRPTAIRRLTRRASHRSRTPRQPPHHVDGGCQSR